MKIGMSPVWVDDFVPGFVVSEMTTSVVETEFMVLV